MEEIQEDAVKCKHCGEFLNKKPTEKWYFKNSSIVTLFVLIGPLALPAVWFNPRFSRTTKILITAVSLIVTYILTIVMTRSVQSILEYYKQLQATL